MCVLCTAIVMAVLWMDIARYCGRRRVAYDARKIYYGGGKASYGGRFSIQTLTISTISRVICVRCYWVLWEGRASYSIASIIMVEG